VVVDSAGAPVPFANIVATGSQRRVAAGADGTFQLLMDSSAKRGIEVRRIGYLPQTQRVSNIQGQVVPVAPYLVQIRTTPQLPFID